jgi:acetate kinase
MRTLRQSKAPEAAEAIALFVYRIVREIGSLTAALGGLDGLVFTAGIGEHDPETRAEVAAGCGWLGLKLDTARNRLGGGRISAAGASVAVWVVPTDGTHDRPIRQPDAGPLNALGIAVTHGETS